MLITLGMFTYRFVVVYLFQCSFIDQIDSYRTTVSNLCRKLYLASTFAEIVLLAD